MGDNRPFEPEGRPYGLANVPFPGFSSFQWHRPARPALTDALFKAVFDGKVIEKGMRAGETITITS